MTTSITLSELADILNAKLHGDAHCEIFGIATLEDAKPGQISFLDNPRYRKFLASTKASAVILAERDLAECPTHALVVANPYLGFAKAAQAFKPKLSIIPGIHPTAIIGEHCQIHASASIGPYCVIGSHTVIGENVVLQAHCSLGEHVVIEAHSHLAARVTCYHGVHLGQRNIIHSGVVIGSDGFGLANDAGVWQKVPQLGGVVIGNDVEIGANTTIDRGALNDTIIEDGVKLDNQIQIAHNVRIGAHTAIAGCVGIAGSSRIGKYCIIAGGVGIAGHIEIADRVIVTGMSRVTHSITEPGIYSSGSPLQANQQWRKNSVRMRQLDEMARRLHQLEKVVTSLSE